MDYLRDGIHLRAMAQKDPLVEYRAEGHAMFEEPRDDDYEEVVLTLFHAQIEVNQPEQLEPQQGNGGLQYTARDNGRGRRDRRVGGRDRRRRDRGRDAGAAGAGHERAQGQRPQRPVLRGSGKKFKKCHGA